MYPHDYVAPIVSSIKNRPPSPVGKWYLTFEKNNFICKPATVGPRPEVILFTLTYLHVTEGLTSREWDQVLSNVFYFLLEKGMI